TVFAEDVDLRVRRPVDLAVDHIPLEIVRYRREKVTRLPTATVRQRDHVLQRARRRTPARLRDNVVGKRGATGACCRIAGSRILDRCQPREVSGTELGS